MSKDEVKPKLIEVPLRELDSRFLETEYVVSANSFEKLTLWSENHDRCQFVKRWRQEGRGLFVKVGEFGGLPINVNFFWDFLDERRVAFYEAVSLVVHVGVVDEWLRKHCNPFTKEDRRAHCNALNFAHCAQAIRKKQTMTFAETLEMEAKNGKAR